MAKLTVNNVGSGYLSTTALNDNFDLIEAAVENTLSRDGTGPNQMEANLDMNGNLILNSGNAIPVSGFTWEGPWLTTTGYSVGDIIENNGTAYMCVVAHTSGTFATDLAAGKWQVFATASLPSQTGNAGEFLQTDGVTTSWQVPDASEVSFTQTGTGAVERTQAAKNKDSISVLDFGAVADGADTGVAFIGTDNTTAFQAALDHCGANRTPLHIPAGKYRFAALTVNDTSALLLNHNYHVIVSDGAELLIDDDVPNTYSIIDFIRTPSLGSSVGLEDRELLHISGVTFRGRWSHSNTYAGTNVLTVENFAKVELYNISAYDLRAKFSRSRYNGQVDILWFKGERIASDCLRFVDCPRISVSGADFMEVDDDCIAISSTADIPDPRQQITISNVRVKKSEGILILGARNITISNVSLRMCMGTQIYLGGQLSTEGPASPYNINISNISIVDPLNRANGGSNGTPPTSLLTTLDASLVVAGIEPSSVTTAARPEFYDAGSGTFVLPYDADTSGDLIFQNYDNTVKTVNGAFNVNITGFNIIRTLPEVTNYSDWGLGLAFSRYGRFDPAVTTASFATHGVMLIGGSMKNAVVSSGNVFGFPNGAAVYLQSNVALAANRDREFENILISSINGRHVKYGVAHSAVAAASTFTWGVSVIGCTFDCDPYCESSARTSPLDGSWQTGIGVSDRPVGVYFRMAYGWKIQGNTFSNCYDPVLANTNYLEQADLSDNLVKCQPVAVGFSTSNKGIGLLPAGGKAFTHMVLDCNPTSATYMEIGNVCISEASAVPTSGTYVTGHFVRNKAPTTTSSKTTLGWVRQSVGATHAVATTTTADWAPVVATTS